MLAHGMSDPKDFQDFMKSTSNDEFIKFFSNVAFVHPDSLNSFKEIDQGEHKCYNCGVVSKLKCKGCDSVYYCDYYYYI